MDKEIKKFPKGKSLIVKSERNGKPQKTKPNLTVNKRGQITIWVIIAIVIVASLIIFFLLRGKTVPTSTSNNGQFNPETSIQSCVQEYVNNAIDLMLLHGGFINPSDTKMYDNVNVSYLCKNTGNYNPCINQHPMFLNEMEDQITNYISPKIDSCFLNLKNEIEKRNGQVNFGVSNISISLAPDRVYVNINKKIIIEKNGETNKINNTEVTIISPLYNLGMIAMTIANEEAKYCSFPYVGYMALHPRYLIKENFLDDSTKIYNIEDTQTGKSMNIAIRGCAIPAGI